VCYSLLTVKYEYRPASSRNYISESTIGEAASNGEQYPPGLSESDDEGALVLLRQIAYLDAHPVALHHPLPPWADEPVADPEVEEIHLAATPRVVHVVDEEEEVFILLRVPSVKQKVVGTDTDSKNLDRLKAAAAAAAATAEAAQAAWRNAETEAAAKRAASARDGGDTPRSSPSTSTRWTACTRSLSAPPMPPPPPPPEGNSDGKARRQRAWQRAVNKVRGKTSLLGKTYVLEKTPLHRAAMSGREAEVRALLAGAYTRPLSSST